MKAVIREILKFKNDRNWDQFHNVKDLLIGLNIEVGELQELMIWKRDEEIEEEIKQSNLKQDVSNEIADIFIFLIYLSDKFKIDIEEAVKEKIEIHKVHYPIEVSKGRRTKYKNLNDQKE